MNFEDAVSKVLNAVNADVPEEDRERLIKEAVLSVADRSNGGDSITAFYVMIRVLALVGNQIQKEHMKNYV